MQSAFFWAPKVVRKCESKHWYACGADGRSLGRSVARSVGPVIPQFLGWVDLFTHGAPLSTNWKLFKEAWCNYVTAPELNKKPKEGQAGALCSVMGMDCVKVMNSLTTLTASDKKDPEKILSALSDHFMPQKHLLFERVKFGFASQAENESIDQYVLRLRQLVESCEFENICESLIRDRLVIGT